LAFFFDSFMVQTLRNRDLREAEITGQCGYGAPFDRAA
jgi:hypothetical protein